MKVIDNELRELMFNDDQEMENLITLISNFLIDMISDQSILDIIKNHFDEFYMQYTDGYNYQIKTHEGKFRNFKIQPNHGAFVVSMITSLENDILKIIPGICVRPNFSRSQLIHELFHVLSYKQVMNYQEDGLVYTKCGTEIRFYDKNLNDVKQDKEISSTLLNEGITDYLTGLICGDSKIVYAFESVIVDLLNRNNSDLLKSYFSNNLVYLNKFYKDFDEKQNIISSSLLKIKSLSEVNFEEKIQILQASINYCLKLSTDDLLEDDKDYIKSKLAYLDEFYMLDRGSWVDLVNIEVQEKIR